ncbi:hypothetical protein ACQPZQ_41785 [Pseudonocardia sp. CA-142604]|uniref:hypothetical protein n=1 Tax=Pseudonocardia sp. CA-142604 TaxID=3240024 RepID=UPI003D8F5ABE
MRRSYTAVVGLVLAAALVACGSAGTGGGAGGDESSNGAVVIRDGDRELARFDLAALQTLQQVDVDTPQSAGDQVQTGPTIRSVLDKAGVADVSVLRVEGRDPAQTLSATDLAARPILAVTNRGTVKLAGADLPTNRWVRDVTALVANP